MPESGGGMFGFNFSGSKTKSFVDPKTRAAMFGNLDQANSLPQFQGFSQGLLSQFQDPYQADVIKGVQSDIEQQRLMASNATGDAASAAGAFGGSRHGVAQGISDANVISQGNLLTSQLRSQGFSQALQAAMQQMLAQNQYGLLRQGTITDALRAITPNMKGTSMTGGMQSQINFAP